VFNLNSRLQYETLHEERGRGGRKLHVFIHVDRGFKDYIVHVFMWTGVSKIIFSIYLAKLQKDRTQDECKRDG
jgi:hypothetical protein